MDIRSIGSLLDEDGELVAAETSSGVGRAPRCLQAVGYEREQLVARVRELETVLADSLAPLRGHALVAEVRAGTGLLAAVEVAEDARLADPGLVSRLVTGIRERGVITRGLRGAALQVSPPFIITDQEISQIADTFTAALDTEASRAARLRGVSE